MSFHIGSIANSFFSKSQPKVEAKKPEIELMKPLDQVTISQDHTNAELIPGITQKDADSLSEKALLLDEIRYLSKLGAGTCIILTGIGAVGAVGMTAASLHGMMKAKDPLDKVDYGTGVGWGIQSGLYIANQLGRAGAAVIPVANAIGAVGGLTEIGVGVKKLYDGVKKSDSKKKMMGMFDIGIGVAWAGASVIFGGPVGSALFLGLSGAKILFKNKDKIKGQINKLLGRKPKQAQEPAADAQKAATQKATTPPIIIVNASEKGGTGKETKQAQRAAAAVAEAHKSDDSPVIILNVPEKGATGKQIKEAQKTAVAAAEAHKSEAPQVIIVNVPEKGDNKPETKPVNKSEGAAEPQKNSAPQVIVVNVPESTAVKTEMKAQDENKPAG